MEFQRLTRRELQTLCKKNKIPANITNVAMTQALKSLSFVEGIEEFMQPSQSETAQSSIESPDRKEVTSPRIPPTGGRTTRRRTAVKEEPETLQPMTRTTRRSTRKILATDDVQTPSVVQTTRRARVNSVCRKMDSQLKECQEEEKRNSLVTPAPSGVSTRRRRGVKEETVVMREYSTRRSVRLAAKKVEDVPDLKVDVFTKEGENVNMNIKESLDSVEEFSGITGKYANAIVDKNFEQREKLEVVSAQKHNMQIGEGDEHATPADTLEGIGESDDVQAEGHAHTGKEIDDQKMDGRSMDVNTAVDENLEENSEEEEELETVSAQKHGIQIGEGDSAVTVHNLAGECEPEDVKPEENVHTDVEIEEEAAFEVEMVQKSEVDDQKLDGRSIDVNTYLDENVEENSEEELEVVSVQKHYMQIGERDDNASTVDTLVEKGESEDVQAERHAHTSNEIEQAAAFGEEIEQKFEVDDQKLEGESIDMITAVDENLEENSEEEELEVVSAQKNYMQIGEEGDDNAATVDNLEGKGEGHAYTSNEIEQPAVFEEEIEQKFEVVDQKLEGGSIDMNTAVDENLGENSEEEELEFVSAQKNYVKIREGDDNAATVDNREGKGESEAVRAEERAYTSKESEQAATFEESEVDNQKLDEGSINVNTSMDKNSEVNDEVKVDSVKELKTTIEKGEGNSETCGLKSETKEAKKMERETAFFVFDTEVEVDEHNGENTVHEGALDVCNWETETETSSEIAEQSDTDKEAGFEGKACDVENFEHETGDKYAVDFLVDTETCNKMEKDISAHKDMEFKQLPPLNANEAVLEIKSFMHGDVVENELNLGKSPKSIIVEAKEHENDAVFQVTNSNEDVPAEIRFAGSDSDIIVKPTCLTPYKVSATKASPMMKSLTIMSDNKENIDSGSKVNLPKVSATEASPMMKRKAIMSDNKVAIAKNTDGNGKEYDDATSMRKLAKMLKNKLQITNKLSKNENMEVRGGRLALKELPGNQLMEETHYN